MNIKQCSRCKASIPEAFLKQMGGSNSILVCRACFEECFSNWKQLSFWPNQSKEDQRALRKAAPKFPEQMPKMNVNDPRWPNEFANYCTRKANWYGLKDAFEFMDLCLK